MVGKIVLVIGIVVDCKLIILIFIDIKLVIKDWEIIWDILCWLWEIDIVELFFKVEL